MIDAVMYATGFLGRRDPRTWVFGNVKGFRDNPRYLAEHVAAEYPRIAVWWLGRTDAELELARAAGLRAAHLGTRSATRILRRAGVAFVSNGFQDLEARHLGGAFVVDLRHGKGLKRVLLDMPRPAPRGPVARLGVAVRRFLVRRRLAQVDMIVAAGTWAADRYATAFAGPRDRIRVLGTPRFDVVLGGAAFDRLEGGAYRARLGVAPRDYLALWLPTWRDEGDEAWLPRLTDEMWREAVADSRLVVVVKPHPYSDQGVYAQRLPNHPRFLLLREDAFDANALLRAADALVTDFSSAAFDFALLDRPIFFFVPDADRYRGGQGLYEPLEALSGGHERRDWAPLLADLRRATDGDDRFGLDAAHRIRDLAGHDAAPGSSERITRAVAASVGLWLDGPPSGHLP